ncbi:MAG: hypothetical protein JWN66_1708 [Sphingomonas bacterium]|uniref:DUF924 family protein n=1 Tax=Sphingomonas bacterium TaxID=1895847 RepID=UPI0026075F60|nr:DUF924 family protein [Sphingomonas bacterium]MDB5704592.1 hypothetical protein [Sphingomonas bacterium]
MRGDLGAGSGEVHDMAQAVLDFWFGEVPAEKRFARDDGLDRTVAGRFGAMREAVLGSEASGWRDDPNTLLAAIILLDQFSRNIHRDDSEAFAGDALALGLAKEAIERGWDETLAPERRAFLYMPLMHAEDRETQTTSLACFERLGDDENLFYAREHADVIARFGRFPSRNPALGRPSTPEEEAYLSRLGAGW